MAKKNYDFSGWATKFDIRCSDGRTIRKSFAKANDGKTVPMVWNHNHNDADNVLGHALLEARNEGMYAYCSFNDTEQGRNAKELVKHGDINSLSIYANQLKQNGGDVIHGSIKELSLVLAGANPGALIENVMYHSENMEGDGIRFLLHEDQTFEFDVEKDIVEHSDESNNNAEAGIDANSVEEQASTEESNPASEEINHAEKKKKKKEDASSMENNDKTVKDVLDSLTEEQKTVVYALIGLALEDKDGKETNQEDEQMKHNIFDQNTGNEENTLSHSELVGCIETAKKTGSLREAVKDLALAHGITDIGVLFPDAQVTEAMPSTINDRTEWVAAVMDGVHHTPFSRVKTRHFDITGDEARARGYVKGTQKVQEVIRVLKRETTPQTVYKLQKLDRDDIIDITDFDVVAYIKNEMRGKLDEELARAILTGDGRDEESPYKIQPTNIRPILGDNSVYVVAKFVQDVEGETRYDFAKRLIKEVIRARKDYRGKGNPTFFTTEDILTDMLLIEDLNERIIYETEDKLKTALRVKNIVTVPYLESVSRTAGAFDYAPLGILVNLADYNVGADKGGKVSMFDDFDIDYNKYEYLIETRMSGAMVTPYGAVTFEHKTPHVEPEQSAEPEE